MMFINFISSFPFFIFNLILHFACIHLLLFFLLTKHNFLYTIFLKRWNERIRRRIFSISVIKLCKRYFENMPVWRQFFDLFLSNIFEYGNILFPSLCFICFDLKMTSSIHKWYESIEAVDFKIQIRNLFLQFLNLLFLVSWAEERFKCWFSRLKFVKFFFRLNSFSLKFLSHFFSFLSGLNGFNKGSWLSELIWNHFDVIFKWIMVGQWLILFNLNFNLFFVYDKFFSIFSNVMKKELFFIFW